jgi:hypothetical protein
MLTWPKWQKKSRFGEKKAFLVIKKIGVAAGGGLEKKSGVFYLCQTSSLLEKWLWDYPSHNESTQFFRVHWTTNKNCCSNG